MVDGECSTSLPDAECGVERWGVKTGADADALSVNTTAALVSSIGELTVVSAPGSLPDNFRLSPVERSVYVIDATLTMYRLTDDSDYHVVLSDSAGRTMIVEFPHPNCVSSNSPFKAAIESARATFDTNLRATTSFKTASIPVRVHGIGFFDRLHGQTGVAPNGIELHPVLNIQFHPQGTITEDKTYPLMRNVDRLFNGAERIYPSYFPPVGIAGFYDVHPYRYYQSTGNYIGVANGRVIVHNGRDWNFLDVGGLDDLLPLALRIGY